VEAGRLLDIPVFDHVIVAGERYLSFAEAGLL
jgi:DNA repair protein RadC